jgi:hypothetical protein
MRLAERWGAENWMGRRGFGIAGTGLGDQELDNEFE